MRYQHVLAAFDVAKERTPIIETLKSLLAKLVGAPARDQRWTRITLSRETWQFGASAPADFAAFLKEPSMVRIASIDEACAFLRGCKYVDDKVAFGVPDHWQTPAEFERRRAGDCEDHALWAWRKLHELGYDTELVVGRWLAGGTAEDYHAWVVYTNQSGNRMLLESVTKAWGHMPRPLNDVAHEYLPFHSIDGTLQTFTYVGYLMALDRGDSAAV